MEKSAKSFLEYLDELEREVKAKQARGELSAQEAAAALESIRGMLKDA